MPCPLCGEDRVSSVEDGHEVFACGFSSDGSQVLTECHGGHATCVCPTHDLMTGGCRCGAFAKEQAAKAGGGSSAGASSGSGDPNPDYSGPVT
jgi:hypothetical protein